MPDAKGTGLTRTPRRFRRKVEKDSPWAVHQERRVRRSAERVLDGPSSLIPHAQRVGPALC